MHQARVSDLPYGKFRDKGIPIDNFSNYSSAEEQILHIDAMENLRFQSLLFVTSSGMCKQVAGNEFTINKRTSVSSKLPEGDTLVLVAPMAEMEYVVLQSKKGYFLKFLTEEIPEKKKAALGVRGMRLAPGDELAAAYLLANRMEYTIEVGEKKLTLNKLKPAKRDTKGTKVRI